MSRIGILFTIPNFITAGSGGAMLNIVRRLDRRAFSPAVCVLKKGGALDAVVEDMGIPLLETPMLVAPRPLWSLRRRVQQAAAVFRPYDFQIWHSYHYADDYTEPLVARAAGARFWVFTKKNMSWNRRSWFVRSILASRIAAQNADMLRLFLGPLLRRKAKLIPAGVDSERYAPPVSHRSDLRVRLRIREVALLLGCVANLLPIKGQRTLIQAIKSLPGAHLVLAGSRLDETYACGLERLAEELDVAGRVHMLGTVRDVPVLLSDLDIFVLPSLLPGESCPVALLEAMSSGLACVTSDVPGCREPVVNGRSGLLVPPGDPDALAGALIRLAPPTVRMSFGDEARRRILDRFTLEQEARAYAQMYAELVRERRL